MWSEPEKDAFRREYREKRGYWAEFNEGLLQHSPDWQVAYLKYSSTPASCGPLSPRMRELIYVAVDGSTTHLFLAGLEIHVELALEAGCTAGELVEVLQLATMQGLDSVALGMDVLVQELAAAGRQPEDPHSEGAGALERYGTARGDPPDWIVAMAGLSPQWTEALAGLLAVADHHSRLTEAERAMIRLALASSPTHLAERALRSAVRECLDAGVSTAEIGEVFQLVAHLGLHACSDGIPVIERAMGRMAGSER